MSTRPLRPKEPIYFNFIRFPHGFYRTVCTFEDCYAAAVYENIIGDSHYRCLINMDQYFFYAKYACRQHQFEYLAYIYRLHHFIGQLKDERDLEKPGDN